MNRLSTAERVRVVAALVEGNSINATVRMTGISKPTILKLLKDLGAVCAEHHDQTVRGLKPARVQTDEIWSFVYAKAKNVAKAKWPAEGAGDCWTWTAIDPDNKLIISYWVGLRTAIDAQSFMLDLAGRITNMTQLTSDGFAAYPQAVQQAFGNEVHYAQLIKLFQAAQQDESRYSPTQCIGCRKEAVIGAPDCDHVSTSIVERSNLTIRMSMRRFTRLENHSHAIAMFFQFYNWCRKHSSLGTSPAIAAGLSDHVWSVGELVGLLG